MSCTHTRAGRSSSAATNADTAAATVEPRPVMTRDRDVERRERRDQRDGEPSIEQRAADQPVDVVEPEPEDAEADADERGCDTDQDHPAEAGRGRQQTGRERARRAEAEPF